MNKIKQKCECIQANQGRRNKSKRVFQCHYNATETKKRTKMA